MTCPTWCGRSIRPNCGSSGATEVAMLELGSIQAIDCGRITRRAAIGVGSISVLGLSLADLFRMQASAADQKPPRAKSIILLWLWGGPSHLDTFDMKPKAPVQYRGPYSPVATSVSGIQICELLPHLAHAPRSMRSSARSIVRRTIMASREPLASPVRKPEGRASAAKRSPER